jgi:hypothetical protein
MLMCRDDHNGAQYTKPRPIADSVSASGSRRYMVLSAQNIHFRLACRRASQQMSTFTSSAAIYNMRLG